MARFLMALWLAFLRFITCCFRSPPSALPSPVTAKQRVKDPTCSAVSPVVESSPSRSASPKLSPSNPGHVFHPDPSPFPNISWSGMFATPTVLPSPSIASEIELGRIANATPPGSDALPPCSPSLFQASHISSTSFHTLRSPSSHTPSTPSSAVMVQLDRSSLLLPTTISDGSFQIISHGDQRDFTSSPIPDSSPLPSPWSPLGTTASLDVWMSVDGLLMNATGPVDNRPALSRDSSLVLMANMLTGSRISSVNLYSSSSTLDAFGIVYVNVDDVLSSPGNTPDDPTRVSKLSQASDENLVAQEPHTPHKRQESVLSVTKSHATSFNVQRLSNPTKLDNVEMSHRNSTSTVSSVAYELQLGLFREGNSMMAIDHIISLLNQASPESLPPHNDSDAVQPVEAG